MIEARVAEVRWGLPSRLFQEDAIKPVGHGRAPDGKAVHPDAVRRAFVRRARLTTHQELASGNHYHFRFEVHGHSFTFADSILYFRAGSMRTMYEFCSVRSNREVFRPMYRFIERG